MADSLHERGLYREAEGQLALLLALETHLPPLARCVASRCLGAVLIDQRKHAEAERELRRAVELGYRDFRYMREDHDLDSIRHDPRFRQLLREYENR